MSSPPTVDLLLSGGRVIDPARNLDHIADVGVRGREILGTFPPDTQQAERTIDVSGCIITPGLIDLHVHVFGYKHSVTADTHTLPHGVTTALDTGGAGWQTVSTFRETVIESSTVRILALLNIVGPGMLAEHEQNVDAMDPQRTAAAVMEHRDVVVGIKTAHFGGDTWHAVERTLAAARISETFAMVDFSPRPSRPYRELLQRLRPGDIHTHCYAQHIPLLADDGRVADYMHRARDRGVLFDLGHGAGSFWFRIAAKALELGFPPDTISTDMHRRSLLATHATLPVTMSKLLCLGMPLAEVVRRTTEIPARILGRPELGSLAPGTPADVAVLQLTEGAFGFVDSGGARLDGSRQLSCTLTIRDGKVVWDKDGRTRPNWRQSGEYVRLW